MTNKYSYILAMKKPGIKEKEKNYFK